MMMIMRRFVSKRSSTAAACRIIFDDRLREEFCERLKQQQHQDLSHPRYQIRREYGGERDSAVLVPLVNFNGIPSILFTHRSSLLSDHRGEVSFPGGRLEIGETHEQAALRECTEEIGLHSSKVTVWGCIRPVMTRSLTGTVTPVVGVVQDDVVGSLSARCDEVQTVFVAPIEELCLRHRYTNFKRDNVRYKLPVFFTSRHHIIATNVTPRHLYRIWGLTGGMLHLVLLVLCPKLYQSEIEIAVPV